VPARKAGSLESAHCFVSTAGQGEAMWAQQMGAWQMGALKIEYVVWWVSTCACKR